ncbi:hypothetical protein HYS79_02705 [Patescibacteria group bacterium]|nr:hypothetical protein [Patescibacteria group bacterium]
MYTPKTILRAALLFEGEQAMGLLAAEHGCQALAAEILRGERPAQSRRPLMAAEQAARVAALRAARAAEKAAFAANLVALKAKYN